MKEKNMDVIIMDMGNDIKGESSVPGYESKIELLSFGHGVAKQITGDISTSERSSGKSNQGMTVTNYLDAVTPLLHQRAIEGRPFPRVDILIGRNDAGGVSVLMRYTMKDVLITDVSVSGGGGDKPVETLTLNYNSITWDFK